MQKTKIIREVIGTRIEPYGFKYLKTDGPCRVFVREVTGIKRYYDPDIQVVRQYINIQESQFSQSVIVRFNTDIFGREMDVELEQLKKYSKTGWLEYTDESSYREQLKRIVVLIIKYGFDLLDKLSAEEEIIPTKAMARKLAQRHRQLDQEFIEEYHVKKEPEQVGDIDEWFRLIKQLIQDHAERPYEEVKEMLIKIAAFIGERDCELNRKKWDTRGNLPFVTPISTYNLYHMVYSPLSVVVSLWKSGYADLDMTQNYIKEVLNDMKQSFKEAKIPKGKILKFDLKGKQ